METINIDNVATKSTECLCLLNSLRDGEVDDCRVLFHEEVVLGESFNAKNEVWRKFGQLKPFEKVLLVGFVLLQDSQMDSDILHF